MTSSVESNGAFARCWRWFWLVPLFAVITALLAIIAILLFG